GGDVAGDLVAAEDFPRLVLVVTGIEAVSAAPVLGLRLTEAASYVKAAHCRLCRGRHAGDARAHCQYCCCQLHTATERSDGCEIRLAGATRRDSPTTPCM